VLTVKRIFASVQDSLKRLELEYIDVLQLHRFDPDTPIEETMQALHDVVQAGWVRYVGMSSCWAWQFQLMQSELSRIKHAGIINADNPSLCHHQSVDTLHLDAESAQRHLSRGRKGNDADAKTLWGWKYTLESDRSWAYVLVLTIIDAITELTFQSLLGHSLK
jgi:hypothetical protein